MANWGPWASLAIGIGMAITGNWIGGIYFGVTGQMAMTSAGFMLGSFIGSQIFPTTQETESVKRQGEYPIQGAYKGVPIPIVYGTRRLAGNIIWVGELHPYTIKHSSGGDKNFMGGGGGEDYEEQRYRRSFVIAVCEGTAYLHRVWKGKTLISLSELTWYTGADNSGLSLIVDEEYMENRHIALAYFNEYELGGSQAIPNFIFEVGKQQPDSPAIVTAQGKFLNSDMELMQDLSWGDRQIDMASDGRVVLAKGTGYIGTGSGDLIRIYQKNDADVYVDLGIPFDTSVLDAYAPDSWYAGAVHFSQDATWVSLSVRKALDDEPDSVSYNTLRWNSETGVLLGETPSGTDEFWGMQWLSDGKADPTYYWDHQVTYMREIDCFIRSGGSISPSATLDLTTGSGYLDGSDLNDELVLPLTVLMTATDGYFLYVFYASGPTEQYLRKYSFSPTFSVDVTGPVVDFTPTLIAEVQVHDWPGWESQDRPGIVLGTQKIWVYGSYGSGNGWVAKAAYEIGDLTYVPDSYRADSEWAIENWSSDRNFPRGVALPLTLGRYSPFDMNPADVIWDMLTNTQYGAGISESKLDADSFENVRAYCEAAKIFISLVVNDQKSIYDWIDYICSHFGGYRAQHDGKFSLGVYRDESAVFDLTRDDIVIGDAEDTSPPIQIRKRKYSETFNRIEVAWCNRDKIYDTGIAVANDEVDQRICGQTRSRTISLDGITNAELAQRTAYRLLIESMYRFSIYAYMVSYRNMLLEVGDVGTLTDGFLVDEAKIRITSIGEDVDGRGLAVESMEERAGLYPAIIYPDGQGTLFEPDAAIVLVNSLIYFLESQTENRIKLSIVPRTVQTNGWYIFRSYDNTSYELVGKCGIGGVTAGDANSVGTLTAGLAAASSVVHRSTESFEVNIGTITDLDTAIADGAFFNNLKLARIGTEVFAYKTCVETATAGIWTVSNLIRGLYGTEATAHSIGDTFVTLDNNFSYAYRDEDVGKTLYFKAASYYGPETQAVEDVIGYAVQVKGKISRADGVGLLRLTSDEMDGGGLTYSGATFTLYWNLPGVRGSGFNQGGFDLDESSGGVQEWRYGDDELDLQGGEGINYGYYRAIDIMEDIKLEFYESDGTTLIGTRNILATAESVVITYATDLDSNDTAVIKVIPRTNRLSLTERQITVTKV